MLILVSVRTLPSPPISFHFLLTDLRLEFVFLQKRLAKDLRGAAPGEVLPIDDPLRPLNHGINDDVLGRFEIRVGPRLHLLLLYELLVDLFQS